MAIILCFLLVSGCCSGCTRLFYPDPDTERVLFADDYGHFGNNTTVAGSWATGGPNAAIVDPGIAFYSWYGNASDGQWLILKDSGYYQFVKMSTDSGARNGLYRFGQYRVENDTLLLFESNESYYPGPNSSASSYRYRPVPDERLTFRLANDTMDLRGGAESGTYYRLGTE